MLDLCAIAGPGISFTKDLYQNAKRPASSFEKQGVLPKFAEGFCALRLSRLR